MSEDAPIFTGPRSFMDRGCSVSCEPVGDHGDLDLTISFEAGVSVRLPMTAERAKALGRMLTTMAEEGDVGSESSGATVVVLPTRSSPRHSEPVSLKSRRQT